MASSDKHNGGLVYSSTHGRMCPGCNQPVGACTCKPTRDVPVAGDGVVRLRRETKGRKGKGVTIVDGVPLPPSELKVLAKRLKQLCGSGGTIKGAAIELQGDHRDKLRTELQARGFVVRG